MLDEDLVFSIEENENEEANTETDKETNNSDEQKLENEVEEIRTYSEDIKETEYQKQKRIGMFKRIWKRYITKRKRTKLEIIGDVLFCSGIFILITSSIVDFIQKIFF